MAQTNTTTTVTTTTSTREGTKLVVDSVANTQSVGSFVTGVSLQPYIANRIISFYAYNMRPNQRLHIFFDSVLVDDFCAPAVRNASNNYSLSVTNTSDYKSIEKDGNWGAAIYSDSNGIVAGQFNLPAGRFKTGERVLQITDVDSIAIGSSAYTTMSSATFVASNLSVTRESVTLTTVNPELSFVPVVNTVVTSTTNVVIRTTPDNIRFTIDTWEPIAQSLTINTPDGEAGIFATSIDLFFRQKPVANTDGVTVYLTEMDNGYPNGNKVLPLSTVHKSWSEVNVSNNATSPTTFEFEAPVYLASNNEYAFIIKPDSNNPDYQAWSANLGDIDVNSGYQVFSQPVLGTAFYGATTKQWTALQTEYIKFTLNRAFFTSGEGEAVFYNTDTDFISIYNVEYSNNSVGILPGDYVFKAGNSTINANGGTVNTSVYGVVDFYDSGKGILYVDNTTGNFTSNSFIQIHRFANNDANVISKPITNTYIASANTGELHDIVIDAYVPQLATISPPGTSLKLAYVGTSNSLTSYVVDSNETRVISGYETEFYDKERVVVSRSTEISSSLSGDKSFALKAKMTTDTEYLSPVIDTVRNQQLAIKNDIDLISFNYDEFFVSSNTKSKYVSKIVTLAPGQDSQDLQVTLTAFRPYGSDIQVWFRVLSGEDPDPITLKTWAPMYNMSPDLYSDPSNPNDFREFSFGVGSYYTMSETTGNTSSSNSGVTVTGTGTKFDEELKPGWYVNMRANSSFSEQTRKIITIGNTTTTNTVLTLDSAFIGNYTNEPIFLVPPPTTPWLATDYISELTGNVTVSTTNNSITGYGTAFDTELKAGNIISVANDSQVIVSISNSSYLTVGTPWSSSVANTKAYLVSDPGISYLNDNLSLFTNFNQFQIKIILQSIDTSKVPILDDLRVLALQL